MQINHPGRQAQKFLTGCHPVAPSAVSPRIPGFVTPRALEGREIEEIISRFAVAAGVAQAAGYDGGQFHGAHGYLISQFLSPLANRRDDAWGGDQTRRMRFVLEIVRAARDEVGPAFPIGIKLNSADFQRGSFSEDESMAVIDALAQEGIDLVEVSGGTYGSPAMMGQSLPESTRRREAYFQTYAEKVRRRTPGVKLMLTGGFRTRAAMQSALDDDACDLIGIARSPCIDPAVVPGLLNGSRTEAPVDTHRAGVRWLLSRVTDVKLLDGAVDLFWHSEQMRRIGTGSAPAPDLSWYQPLWSAARRNGVSVLRRKRS